MEKQLITSAGQAVTLSAFGLEVLGVVYDLRWGLLLIVALIVADFWLGIAASVHVRREEFRFSRAGRRTCAKFAEYFTFMVIGALLGLAIFEPLSFIGHTASAGVCLGLGCLFEVDSIVGHVCDLHGIKTRFSIKRALIALLKGLKPAVGDAVEKVLEESSQKNDKEPPTAHSK